MSTNEITKLINKLQRFSHSLLKDNWAEKFLLLRDSQFEIVIPFASDNLFKELSEWIDLQSDLPKISIKQKVAALKASESEKKLIKGIKNLLLIFSNKGGVGKSATAVNLALSLQTQGAKVGLLDADIYGPSLPTMLGTKEKTPETLDGRMMEPIIAHGLATNSIGYLIPDSEAMVWRGPMAAKAFAQLLNETNWGELDYLIVDMPPGTGDIQLSMAQQFPVTAAIVITTPQDLALIDAMKGVVMFNKVNVPVLGVVENMSYHICENCGHHDAIFGEGGAEFMAKELGIELLGQIPLATAIRKDIDLGIPTVIASPESDHTRRYIELAQKVAAELFWQGETAPEQITIQVV